MTTNDSYVLNKKVEDAIEICNTLHIEVDSVDYNIDDIINKQVNVKGTDELYFDIYDDDDRTMSVDEFIDIINKIDDYQVIDNSYVFSNNEAIFLVEFIDYDSYSIFENATIPNENFEFNKKIFWKTNVVINSIDYTVGLVDNSLSVLDFVIKKEDYYDKEYCHYENAIMVRSNNNLDLDLAKEIADAFIFELASTHGIKLKYTSLPIPLDIETDLEEHSSKNYNIFPILVGKGLNSLINIYNSSLTIDDTDYKILCLTQVIEYVAPSIIRMKLNEEVMKKLSSPNVLNPNAMFIKELEGLFKDYSKNSKDRELIKNTVMEIVDFNEVLDLLPNYILEKRKRDNITKQVKEDALNKLAQSISDTRNEIAHAKANYQKNGNECPLEDRDLFAKLLSVLSCEAIRWFARLPEEKRIVD